MSNYIKKLLAETANLSLLGNPGSLTIATVKHDEWCGIFNGALCNCDPAIEYEQYAEPNRKDMV